MIIISFFLIQEIYLGIKDFKSAKELAKELETVKQVNNIDSKKYDNKSEAKISYNKLKSMNNDYKFWINIENTKIDYPVVQTIDNDFYLRNSFKKIENKYGAIFVDSYSDFYKDFNTIIYGHNMKNGEMFTNIIKYKDKDFFEQNNKINIIDKDFKYVFEPVSVYTIRGFDNPSYLYEINKMENKKKGLEELENRSLFNSKKFGTTEKIITLITCSYEKEDTRTVVHAKLINKINLNSK